MTNTKAVKVSTLYPDKARFIGSLQGLILGDIIGSYHEFSQPAKRTYLELNALKHQTNVFGMGFSYTDDTILTLEAMEAFVASNGNFDGAIQLEHARAYIEHRSRWSPNGRCFDVGISTQRSLQQGDWPEKTSEQNSGNGVLMRLLPFAWHFACRLVSRQVETISGNTPLQTDFFDAVTNLTHGSEKTLTTSRLMGELLTKLLFGIPWREARQGGAACYPASRIDRSRSYRGYCEDSLVLAIALMDEEMSWEEGIAHILSLGGDTDSNAAVFGQLYGACYPDAIRTRYAPHKPDIFRANVIDRLIETFIASTFEETSDRLGSKHPWLAERKNYAGPERAYSLSESARRDNMPYAMRCPRDCVHYGEGCLLGFPVEDLRYFQRHSNPDNEAIPRARSDSHRLFWTTALGRAAPPDTPPCYHNGNEATPDCQYSICGHLPKTVARARKQAAINQAAKLKEYGQRLFLIDSTGTEEHELAMGRVRRNAIRKQEFVAGDGDIDQLIAEMVAYACAVMDDGLPIRISVYSLQDRVRDFDWETAFKAYRRQINYLGVWMITRSPRHWVDRKVLIRR